MKKWQIIIGIVLITLGVFSLVDVIFEINFSRFIGPLILIGIGLLLIFRHQLAGPGVEVRMPVLGDIHKSGNWEARRHEFWWFVGETKLDFSNAIFPEGEAKIKVFGFVNDVKIYLPSDVGLCIRSFAFLSDFHGLGKKEERFFASLDDRTPNYDLADKLVEVQIMSFVAEIRVISA
ncbi:MAG: cell wall-active antibiotics response protein LiaF [Brevefilum sp.]|nr:cell wall-active antibiotics response protein LiaF [Brevefilum sp.]MDW7754968.1 cell wall-active antibiotics response protein LiaF [Brevefilum sp.]